MAKLPGAEDLGPTPAAQVVGTDTSAFARGGAAISAGVSTLGKGISALGEGMASLAIDQNRWDFARAQSDFLSNKVDLDTKTAQDANPGPDDSGKTLPQRYDEGIKTVQQNAANLISDPNMRERFLISTAPHVAQGVKLAELQAGKLQNNQDIAWVGQEGDRLIDQAVTHPDEDTRRQIIDSHNQLVDGLVAKRAISPVQGLAMKREWAQQYAEADVRARVDRGDFSVVDELRNSRGTNPEPAGDLSFDPKQFPKAGDRSSAVDAVNTAATNLGIAPRDLAAAISYETGGKFDPNLRGGKGNNYLGLIQFGPEERAKYGVRPGMSFADQMTAVESYLRDRGVKPGMGLPEIYSIINAGSLDRNGQPRWNASDGNGTVRSHVANIEANHYASADKFLGSSGGQPVKLASADTGNATDSSGASDATGDGASTGGAQPAAPKGGSIYSFLPPDRRERLIDFAQGQQHKAQVQDLANFKGQIEDSQAEFDRTGDGVKIPQETFVAKLGKDDGPQAYQQYSANVQTSLDRRKLATMNPAEQEELIRSYTPKTGDGFADQAQRQDMLIKEQRSLAKERDEDPAGFAVQHLPASEDAYKGLLQTLSDPTSSDDARKTAARAYASAVTLEQQRIGIGPDQQSIVPKDYVDNFNKTVSSAASSDDPQKRIGLVGQIQREATMWGDQWPKVMRQLAPSTQPIVRAIAAGADPVAMTRLLSLDKNDQPAKLLKEQNETKAAELNTAINNEMAPFKQTMVGRQTDRDFTAYFNLAQQLGALYVRDGKSAADAASAAFQDLIGKRYDFRDTYRIPKAPGVPSADDIQAGTITARRVISGAAGPDGQGDPFGIKPAIDDMHLSNNRADSFSKFARDGKFVTSPDNNGLNLVYGDKFIRGADGNPVFFSWDQLSKLGTTPEERKRSNDAAILQSEQSP